MPYHEPGLEQDVEPFLPVFVESFHDRSHGSFGLLSRFLADGRQVDVCEPGQHAVVVAGHGDVAGNVDAGPEQLVEESDGALIVGGTDRGRASSSAQQLLRGEHA